MKTFCIEIVTPTGTTREENIRLLTVAAADGRLTVLADHQPLVCALTGGVAEVEGDDGIRRRMEIGPGVMTVENNQVSIVTRSAPTHVANE